MDKSDFWDKSLTNYEVLEKIFTPTMEHIVSYLRFGQGGCNYCIPEYDRKGDCGARCDEGVKRWLLNNRDNEKINKLMRNMYYHGWFRYLSKE